MSKQIALFICVVFILWLFVRDRKLRPMTSWALWIPLFWVIIIGSRPVSLWFEAKNSIESPEDYLDGSPFDRNVYLALIIAGLLILLMRRVNWGRMFTSNRWVFLFIIYCGVSVIWSEYSFVSFKRWIKDVGNVIMILVILTETNHVQALKAVFVRYAYLAIPLSVLLIMYFPDIGTHYNATWDPSVPGNWSYGTTYNGIATGKNELGAIIYVCGLFLIWDYFEARAAGHRNAGRADLLGRVMLTSMAIWLLVLAHSATSTVCLLLGAGIFLFMRLPTARRQVRRLGTYSMLGGILALVVYAMFSFSGILESLVRIMGRNLTFTGRTELWVDVLNVPINPAIGAGYMSFWLGRWADLLWVKYPWHPNQAHNGYLEIYLNGGLIGISLLLALIIATGSKLKKALIEGSLEGALLFAFFITILFFNWTEAMFFGTNLLWFIMLFAALRYPRSPATGYAMNPGRYV